MVVLLPQKKVRWKFGNIAHILFARRQYLQSLYAEKAVLEDALPVKHDPKHNRLFIPEESRVQHSKVFEKVRIIREEIGRTFITIKAAQAEMLFQHRCKRKNKRKHATG